MLIDTWTTCTYIYFDSVRRFATIKHYL